MTPESHVKGEPPVPEVGWLKVVNRWYARVWNSPDVGTGSKVKIVSKNGVERATLGAKVFEDGKLCLYKVVKEDDE